MLKGNVWADMFPMYSVDWMCDKADVIIECTYLANNVASIDKVYKTSELLKKDDATIEVKQLSQHSKILWNGFNKTGNAIKTQKIVLFLNRKITSDVWESIATIDDEGSCGSCGLFWFDDLTCYGYRQARNPGPYVLMPATSDRQRIPKTINALRKDIETGLVNSTAWRAALAINNPTDKARALSQYLIRRTAPQGDKGTYLFAVREPMRKLGKDAFPALMDILQNTLPEDDLNETILILFDIGIEARPASPYLCKLLSAPKQVHTTYVLSALESIRDKNAIPFVRPLLKHADFATAVKAAEVLSAMNDKESVEEIISLVLRQPKEQDKYAIRDLLNALYALDQDRAMPIIRRMALDGTMVDVLGQIHGLEK